MDITRALPPFRCDEIDKSKLHKEWDSWKHALECYFESEDICDQKKKRAKLLHLGGPQLQALFRTLPDCENFSYVLLEKKYYDVAIQAFDNFFKPGQQNVLERHKLRRMQQTHEERFAEFVVRIRQQIGECGLEKYSDETRGAIVEMMLVDTIVEGCRSDELRKRILQKDRSVEEIIDLGKSIEGVEQQVKDFGSKRSEVSGRGEVYKVKSEYKRNNRPSYHPPSKIRTEPKCFKCGQLGHISSDAKCPAKAMPCNFCKRLGHFKSECRRLKMIQGNRAAASIGFRRERMEGNEKSKDALTVVLKPPHQKDTGDNDLKEVATESKTYYAFYAGNNTNVLEFTVGGVGINLLVDSGAEANLISQKSWEELKSKEVKVAHSKRGSDRILRGYASDEPLTVIGTFVANISVGAKTVEAEFFVIKDGQRSLLGDQTAKMLGVLKVGVDVNQVSERPEPLTKITGIQIHIHMNPAAKPVFQPVRRLPVALEDAVYRKLDELAARDIIEEKTGPVSWVSPLVVVGKSNGEPRICLDLRRVNQAVVRERHPMPLIDDFFARVGSGMIRSKLDIMDSFLQLELDEESRDIMVFITNRGIARFKRMPFGLVTAPEIFQKMMDETLAGCEGAWWFIDDIYVEGKDKQEHDVRLAKVMARLKERNVKLNLKKCVFGVTEMQFLGHMITEKGITPTVNKVEALLSFRRPENANEVRSYLGLANYLNRFIPNLATIDEPLRSLTKKGVPFVWSNEHESAFEEIRTAMTRPTTLGYFKVGDRTLIMADASPTGLGAILIQISSKGEHRIISYASKSLTDTEKRYCHTEKEALSLVWSAEKFYIYLYGNSFEILTDCKALIYLFTHRSRPCARIERWVLRLQGFEYSVTYIPGETNLADVLSRLATLRPIPFDRLEELMIREIADTSSRAVAIQWNELIEASRLDHEIQNVLNCLHNDREQELPLEFRIFSKELCDVEGVLMRSDRIVIPGNLRDRVLKTAHEGHLGMQMMKSALRSTAWWPKIDRDVELFVKKCRGCVLVSAPNAPEPMSRKQMPSGPWEQIAIDFLGPLPEGQFLLVAVDYYSRFVEVAVMSKITAKDTIEELVTIFGRFGVPYVMRADNGPQFSAECVEFKQFCTELGIDLVNTIPYWPQANGEVERQNETILKRLRIAQELGQNWRLELRRFLLAYHATNHTVTGKAPSELMFGRRIRSKLPTVPKFSFDASEARDRDKILKEKGKEYANKKRRAKESPMDVGDRVYVKRMRKENKLASDYSPEPFIITEKCGSEARVQSTVTGRELKRNVVHLKEVEQADDQHSEVGDQGTQEVVTDQQQAAAEQSDNPELAKDGLPRKELLEVPAKRRRTEPKKFDDYIPY